MQPAFAGEAEEPRLRRIAIVQRLRLRGDMDLDRLGAAERAQQLVLARMVARGLPQEAVKMAERRLIDVNRAWEEISAMEAA